jgi:hypothetical protein
MPYCPVCRGEFRQGFSHCGVCEVALVESLDQARPRMDEASMVAYLAEQDLVMLASSPLDRLKPLKNLLCQNGIANMIVRPDSSCGSGNCITGGCSPSLELVIAAQDIERAMTLLHAEFKELVASVEAVDDPDSVGRAVELDAEQFACPACDEMVTGGSEECPHCGLYVGVPEELLASDPGK